MTADFGNGDTVRPAEAAPVDLTQRLTVGASTPARPATPATNPSPVASPAMASLSERLGSTRESQSVRRYALSPFGRETFWLAHPAVWAGFGVLIFLTAWLFPPALYSSMFGDPTFVFGDMRTLLFNTGCVACLMLGFQVSRGRESAQELAPDYAKDPLAGAPLTTAGLFGGAILVNLGAAALYVQRGGIGAWRSAITGGHGLQQEMYDRYGAGGGESPWVLLLTVGVFLTPVLMVSTLGKPEDRVRRLMFWVFVATFAAAAVLSAKRNLLVRPMFAALLVYVVWPNRPLKLSKALGVMAASAAAVLTWFVALAVVRKGSGAAGEAVSELTRYLISPYSTEAAFVNGVIRMEGTGTGYFWTQWIWEFPVLGDALGLEDMRRSMLGPPTPMGALSRGRILGPNGITTGTAFPAFLCSFLDFGWFGMLPFLVVGWLCGLAWRSFLRCGLLGVMFFPQITHSFAEWRANLLFPRASQGLSIMLILVIAACMLVERPKGARR